jgi:hypothetical protein
LSRMSNLGITISRKRYSYDKLHKATHLADNGWAECEICVTMHPIADLAKLSGCSIAGI